MNTTNELSSRAPEGGFEGTGDPERARLHALAQLGRHSVAEPSEVVALFGAVTDVAARLLAPFAAIWALDPVTEELSLVAQSACTPAGYHELARPIGSPVPTGQAAPLRPAMERGELLLSSDLDDYDDVPHVRRFVQRTGGIVAWVPMRSHLGHRGILMLADGNRTELPVTDLEFAVALADRAATASDQAQLLRDLQTAQGWRHLAQRDPLTGLFNRKAILDELHGLLQRGNGRTGVFLCDLDGFKWVNDHLGHAAGDALLQEVADQLRATVRSHDLVGRLGGDEFVVLCPDLSDGGAQAMAQRLVQQFAPTADQPRTGLSSISVGGVVAELGADASRALHEADTAMYEAKRRGRNGWVLYDEALRERTNHREATSAALAQAIQDDQIVLEFEPIVDPRSGRLVGAHVTPSWCPAGGPVVRGSALLSAATYAGLQTDLEDELLSQVFTLLEVWQRQPWWEDRFLQISLSQPQVLDPSFVNWVLDLAARTGADLRHVAFQITEAAVTYAPQQVLQGLHALAAAGVGQLGLEDIGCGRPSLADLARLPVTTATVNLAALGSGDERRVAMTAAVALTQALGLTVAASDVEDPAELSLLAELGCVAARGAATGLPCSALELTRNTTQENSGRGVS